MIVIDMHVYVFVCLVFMINAQLPTLTIAIHDHCRGSCCIVYMRTSLHAWEYCGDGDFCCGSVR